MLGYQLIAVELPIILLDSCLIILRIEGAHLLGLLEVNGVRLRWRHGSRM